LAVESIDSRMQRGKREAGYAVRDIGGREDPGRSERTVGCGGEGRLLDRYMGL
jgi:hypothetical protein